MHFLRREALFTKTTQILTTTNFNFYLNRNYSMTMCPSTNCDANMWLLIADKFNS